MLTLLRLFADAGGGASGGTPATGGGEGATPPAATGAQTQPPATGDEGKGKDDSDKRIKAERQLAKEAEARAKAAEAELASLREATGTEAEKALNQARREAKAESDGKWSNHIRNAEVRGALRGAGLANDKFLDLALAAPEFRGLKVDGDTGQVDGVAEAVEAFKKAYPEAFTKAPEPPQTGGQWDGHQGGGGAKAPATLEEAVMGRLAGRT